MGNNNLTAIKLMYKDISIVLKPATSAHNSWTLLSSDLPKLESWEPLENSIPTLTEAAKVLKTRVNALQETWQDLKHIDEYVDKHYHQFITENIDKNIYF